MYAVFLPQVIEVLGNQIQRYDILFKSYTKIFMLAPNKLPYLFEIILRIFSFWCLFVGTSKGLIFETEIVLEGDKFFTSSFSSSLEQYWRQVCFL